MPKLLPNKIPRKNKNCYDPLVCFQGFYVSPDIKPLKVGQLAAHTQPPTRAPGLCVREGEGGKEGEGVGTCTSLPALALLLLLDPSILLLSLLSLQHPSSTSSRLSTNQPWSRDRPAANGLAAGTGKKRGGASSLPLLPCVSRVSAGRR